MPTTIYDLYQPLEVPGPAAGSPPYVGGFTPEQQAMVGALSGTAPTAPPATLPVGTTDTSTQPVVVDPKSTTYQDPTKTGQQAGGDTTSPYTGKIFTQEQISNIGGVVGQDPVNREVVTQEAIYKEDKMLAAFKTAEGGYEVQNTFGGRIKKGKTKTGTEGARQLKRELRVEERDSRNEKYKQCLKTGKWGNESVKGASGCRQKKKDTRTSERKRRRSTFDEYQEGAKKEKKGED